MTTRLDLIIMTDIETLGLDPNSVVTQIAFKAVDRDDPTETVAFEEFYLPWQPQLDAGRTITASTLKFWFDQPADATAKLVESMDGDVAVLAAFVRAYIRKVGQLIDDAKATGGDYEIWAKGPQFDIVMLEDLFKMCGESAPWKYDRVRDLRTLMNVAGIGRDDVDSTGYVKHVALEDCRYQLAQYEAAMKKLAS